MRFLNLGQLVREIRGTNSSAQLPEVSLGHGAARGKFYVDEAAALVEG